LRQKDETETECRPFAACTRDGYVALLPLPPPTAWVFGTKSSAQRKWRKTRSKRAGTFISCATGSGEKIIKEEAKNACARPHSGIRLSVIDEVDNDSMTGEYDNEKTKPTMKL
jgi:hypothetical protein